MRNIHKISIITVLAVLAIVLGFFIYKQKSPKQTGKPQSDSTQTSSNTSTSDDEKKLFNVPGPNASQDEISQHAQLAARLAVLGNEIDITGCKAKPEVLQVKQDSEVTVKNNDADTLVLTFDSSHIFYIDAGKSLGVKAAFIHGPGLYGYRCKNNAFEGLSGFVSITP